MPRCETTDEEAEKAASILRQVLKPLGVKVAVEKEELSLDVFRDKPLESNRIWINDVALEDWLQGRVGQSPCCSVCGPYECRYVEVNGRVYEAITADLIVKVGLLAICNLMGKDGTHQ